MVCVSSVFSCICRRRSSSYICVTLSDNNDRRPELAGEDEGWAGDPCADYNDEWYRAVDCSAGAACCAGVAGGRGATVHTRVHHRQWPQVQDHSSVYLRYTNRPRVPQHKLDCMSVSSILSWQNTQLLHKGLREQCQVYLSFLQIYAKHSFLIIKPRSPNLWSERICAEIIQIVKCIFNIPFHRSCPWVNCGPFNYWAVTCDWISFYICIRYI